ncbi:MAG TPA: MT-A70 family methyltransferase [Trichocoleus sp.]
MYQAADTRGQQKLEMAAAVDGLPSIPCRDYRLVVADPPWRYQLRESDATHRGRTPYPNMSDEQILSLPIGQITAKDAYLLLWVTNNHLPLGFRCLEAWGFQYKGIHTWLKVSSKGTPHIGVGHYGRNCTEQILVAIKGKPGSFTHLGITSVPTVLMARRRQHSQKPELFWDVANALAEKLGGPNIELFARSRREGWDAWGLEADV